MKNHWYIACASSRLAKTPVGCRVFDEPIALYRDADGQAHALEDRCCHRGVQLSRGCVTGQGRLACQYHGWEYDGTGRCVHVPSFVEGTAVPAAFKVRSYPTLEQDHYLWVWMGEGAPVGRPLPIRGAHEHAWKQGSVPARCASTLFLENMLDGAHPVFAHKNAHPAYFFHLFNGFREYEYEVRVTDTGYVLFYPPAADADAPMPAGADSVASFDLPDRVTVFQKGVRTDFLNVLHMVPTGADSCRVEWLTRVPGEAPGVSWCEDEPLTMKQDRVLQESAQQNYLREGDAFERHVPADYATLLTRKVLKLAREGRWEHDRGTLVPRKLMLVRQ